jgi:hypothetical protein
MDFENLLNFDDSIFPTDTNWQELWIEERRKNEYLLKEKNEWMNISKQYIEIFEEEKYKTITKKETEVVKIMEMSKEIKEIKPVERFIELKEEDFIYMISREYPFISLENMKVILTKRLEVLEILKKASDEHSIGTLGAFQRIVNIFKDEENEIMIDYKKEKLKTIFKNNEKIKEEYWEFIDMEIRRFIENLIYQGKRKGLATDSIKILKNWFLENIKNPYLNENDKQMLIKNSGLTKNQVVNWFINKRVRVWRPSILKLFPNSNIEQNKEFEFLKNVDVTELKYIVEKYLE